MQKEVYWVQIDGELMTVIDPDQKSFTIKVLFPSKDKIHSVDGKPLTEWISRDMIKRAAMHEAGQVDFAERIDKHIESKKRTQKSL